MLISNRSEDSVSVLLRFGGNYHHIPRASFLEGNGGPPCTVACFMPQFVHINHSTFQ
ncbi:hypothetical protein IGI04_000904 [Brassica rapa subsp. trilocularis]|uniref:Uncharacterized protein n=1 Tax=Brassica rapa subsp. trilocularis TaxID=1813537 RepID=A0ABQ7NR45_BRACM|nr:hypothetical protein IGI04_000904 [Brassica rapa subsp. trilocularis]